MIAQAIMCTRLPMRFRTVTKVVRRFRLPLRGQRRVCENNVIAHRLPDYLQGWLVLKTPSQFEPESFAEAQSPSIYFRLVKGVASSLQSVVDKAAKTSKRSSISVGNRTTLWPQLLHIADTQPIERWDGSGSTPAAGNGNAR